MGSALPILKWISAPISSALHVSQAVFNALITQMSVIIEIAVSRNKFDDKTTLKVLESQSKF